ncbi:hypothetical protein CspHIS471_0502640 [Cutaneotrichosporon sp. HIS471]|nr:hypothetical protein CspHIS471_0502640 [Cutaneotrichosporon sp. HIS471]
MSRRLPTYGLREYGFDPNAYIHDTGTPPLGNSVMPIFPGHTMPIPMGHPVGHPIPVPMGPPMCHPMPMPMVNPMVGIPPHSPFPPVFSPIHVHCAPHAQFAPASFAHAHAHYAPENPYTNSRGNATIPPVMIEELASETDPIESWASGVPREDRELAQELKDKYGMGSDKYGMESRKSAKSIKSKSKNGSTRATSTQAKSRSGMEMPMHNYPTTEENPKNIRKSTFGITFWKRSGRE